MHDNENVTSERGRTLTLSIPMPDFSSISLPGWRTVLRGSLIFLAVALPLAFYLRTYDSATIKIFLLQLGVTAGAAAWVWGSVREGRFEVPLRSAAIILPAALLLLWNAARFLFSDFRLAGTTGFVMQTAFLLTFILTVVAFTRRDLRRTVLMILGAWAVAVIYGLMQFFGFDPFVWKGAFGEKIFSTLGNPTLFAAYSSLCAPLALALACDEERPPWLRVVAAALSLAAAWLLAWTGDLIARAIFMGLMAVFAAAAWRTLKSGARAAGLLLPAACLVMSLAPFSTLPAPHKDRNPEFLRETWKGTAALIADQPWLGSGPGSFWVRYPAFRRPAVILLEGRHNNETDHPENELLEQWADGGLPAVLLWLWLFGALLYKGAKHVFATEAAEGNIYVGGLWTATAGSVIFMLASVSSRFAAPGWLMFFTAGLLGAGASGASAQADKVLALPLPFGGERRVLAAAVLAVFLLPVYGAVTAFQSDITHNFAIYCSKEGNWAEAVRKYEREVPWAPTYVMSRYFLGNVYADRGEPGDQEKALASYKEVRAIAPDYVSVAYREAKVLEKMGDYRQAIERMERQVQIDPVWEETWLTLAGLYKEIGNIEKAKEAQEKAGNAKARWENMTAPSAGDAVRYSGGVGIKALFDDGDFLVEEVVVNGPAGKAGIRPGDQILDISLLAPKKLKTIIHRKFTPEQAARALTGPPETKVTIVVIPNAQRAVEYRKGIKKTHPVVIQLQRTRVRQMPENLFPDAVIRMIAESLKF